MPRSVSRSYNSSPPWHLQGIVGQLYCTFYWKFLGSVVLFGNPKLVHFCCSCDDVHYLTYLISLLIGNHMQHWIIINLTGYCIAVYWIYHLQIQFVEPWDLAACPNSYSCIFLKVPMMTATKINNTLQIFIPEMCIYYLQVVYLFIYLVQYATLMWLGITGHVY
jgi:hypothetical protein